MNISLISVIFSKNEPGLHRVDAPSESNNRKDFIQAYPLPGGILRIKSLLFI